MRISKPKDGDYRYITKFLWIPKRFNGTWMWLETVTIRQVYLGLFGMSYFTWIDVCLSNPFTGYPENFETMIGDRLLNQRMDKRGKYYCYYIGKTWSPILQVKKI